jgi:hypothetical protein
MMDAAASRRDIGTSVYPCPIRHDPRPTRFLSRRCRPPALRLRVRGLENPEKVTLDATARSSAPGKFVTLSGGTTHYQVAGPETGQVVVLVHGFSCRCTYGTPRSSRSARPGFASFATTC